MHVYLQWMIEELSEDRLPAEWADFDLASFSSDKTLWDYQQQALQNALKVLWKYYEEFGDYQPGEGGQANLQRKQSLWQWYLDNGLEDNFSFNLSKLDHTIASLLSDYYEAERSTLPYEAFINRMSFWMATGSGKTLVIVKLIEILARLIWRSEVPPCDILFLTHRDDLIQQFKQCVAEFNERRSDFRIILQELKEYPNVKHETPVLFREQEMTVFYYRSDNLSDEQKEKIVDFRNYENDGHWFVLLDEAHKGSREDSKRQHIYSILSRNGFLFNFSATFTDPRDIAAAVFNFNLSEYIKRGYGKHLLVLEQEMRAFRDREDYTQEEKQKVVLKTLMMLAYVHNTYHAARRNAVGVYHRPLMLVLVNSVNTEDADLELFFRELERIAREGVDEIKWQRAKDELWQELSACPEFLFESVRVEINREAWRTFSPADFLQSIFNAGAHGEVEVLIRPSNRQEIALKLKAADRPFALIKIGDISGWLKEKLTGYEIAEHFEDESYFARLNEDDSDITILMGSRTFYEGWDSNRPNVVCYINIGMGEDAQKFILQSVGRGVRIEPLQNKRRRLLSLYNSGEVSRKLFEALRENNEPLETLFVFGTNRQALKTVIENLKLRGKAAGEQQLDVFEVNPEAQEHPLLIPVYRRAGKLLAEQRAIAKFEVNREEYEALHKLADTVDDRVLLALADASPSEIAVLRRSFFESDSFYTFNGHRYGDLKWLLRRIVGYLSLVPEEVDRLKELEDEIRHFRHITVALEDISELQSKVERVKSYRNPSAEQQRLIEQLRRGEMTPEMFKQAYDHTTRMTKEENFEYDGKRIAFKYIAQHYYIPVVLSVDEQVGYIRHIIKTPSEVEFLNALEQYLEQPNNKFKEYDWWFFSKLDESLDEVYLPYYDPKKGRIARFKPDFIFWLAKGERYLIAFVDPKGTEHTSYQRKVDGYCAVFWQDGKPRAFDWNSQTVNVHLFLHTDDAAKLPDRYRDFWLDRIERLPERLLGF